MEFPDSMLSSTLPSTHNKSVIWMALQLVTSLITVANKLKVERQVNERQIEWIEQKLILFYNGYVGYSDLIYS